MNTTTAMSSEYPKIETLYDRDPENMKHVIIGALRDPIFGLIDRWLVTEKIDGTNVRVIYEDGTVRIGGKTDNASMPLFLLDALKSRFTAEKLAGADLVGFCIDAQGHRFVFGEVKASTSEATPPKVMFGRSGLVAQLEALRDDEKVKARLVRYLGFRAPHSSWEESFRSAARRYLANPSDVALFGVLVRDVPPNEKDLSARAESLADGAQTVTAVELRAKYLPVGVIAVLAERLAESS